MVLELDLEVEQALKRRAAFQLLPVEELAAAMLSVVLLDTE